jgi:hypothetical protein
MPVLPATLPLVTAYVALPQIGQMPVGHRQNQRAPIRFFEQLRGDNDQVAPHRQILKILKLIDGVDDVAQEITHLFWVREQAIGDV